MTEPVPNPAQNADTQQGIRSIEQSLRTLRGMIRWHLSFRRGGLIVAVVFGAAILLGLIDYVLRLPRELRFVVWVWGVMWTVWLMRRSLWPAVRFSPDLTQLALRLERSPVGKASGWGGMLASGLELSRGGRGDPELSRLAARRAVELFSSLRVPLPGLLEVTGLRRTIVALGAVALLLGGLSFWRPELLRVGSQRVLTPWAAVTWPKRTGIIHVVRPAAHPIGVAYPLRAVLTRSQRPAEETRVAVVYRVWVDDQPGERQRALLTPQGRRAKVDVGVGARPVEGALFERLLDTSMLLPTDKTTWTDREVRLEYWFETFDDSTEPWNVALVEPPGVENAQVTITPPAYAQAAPPPIVKGSRDAGSGRDERSTLSPILAGSAIDLQLTLTKPLPLPDAQEDQAATFRWLEQTIPALRNMTGLRYTLSDRVWSLSFPVARTTTLSLGLRDRFGIAAREEPVFRFEVVPDRAPAATVIDPAQDESILATALVTAEGEGRDDVGLESVALRHQVAKRPADSAGAPPEAREEPVQIARSVPTREAQPTELLLLRAQSTIDVSQLGVAPGDEVWLTTLATDVLTAAGGAIAKGHPSVTSTRRRLRVISESELVEQMRAELNGLRDAASKLEKEQAQLTRDLPQATTDRAAAGQQGERQSAVARRLEPMSRTIERLASRLDRNRLDDPAFESLLEDASGAAQDARAASQKAAESLESLSRAQDPAARERAAQAARENQSGSAQALADLVDLLSENQEDWAVRRGLERLLNEQRQVRSQTGAAEAQSAGKSLPELTQSQREELERIARRQQELSERASRLLDQMEERAAQMSQADPAQAAAMQRAAARARAAQLAEKQQQAAQQARRNQTGQAQQLQQQAEEALQEALDELEDVQQQRDEQLRRLLADVLQSLELLIRQQETELARLKPALEGQPSDGLSDGMQQVHQRTLAVAEKVKAQQRSAERLLSLVLAAADAQASSVSVLRSADPDFADADELERTSLARLKDARDEAKRLDEQAKSRDQSRRRRELRSAYSDLLEAQVVLRADTVPIVDAPESRRTRAAARALGARQEEVRQTLQELRSKTEELQEVRVFDFAHNRLENATAKAAGELSGGQASRDVPRRQQVAIAVLKSLVEALKEDEQDSDKLQESDGGSGGGGGGGGGGQEPGLLPEAAELKLLRGMQAEAADRTRTLGDGEGDSAELSDVSDLQRDLAQYAQELLDRLQQQNAPPTQETTPSEENPPPEDKPANDEPAPSEPEQEDPQP